jgi:hypothetical protein
VCWDSQRLFEILRNSATGMNSSSIQEFINKVDQLVYGCFVTSTDIILQGRRANFIPRKNLRNSHINDFSSNSNFCAQALSSWKSDITIPLFVDVSLLQTKSRKCLIERWKFSYQRRDDLKEGRLSAVKKRIVTFLRTFYSFIRLLPGYQVLKFVPQIPNLLFELSNVDDPPITEKQLNSDTWRTYEFPTISTSKGILSVILNYVDSIPLQVG